jgi:metal transporter CNNM
MDTALIWIGIAFCISQSAMFSGLNLAVFSVSRLRLEIAATDGNRDAAKLLVLRRDSHLTLCTILWGNVAINVLLTLLANSVLFGVAAFLFSTVVITCVGEIAPQAYFSRHAVRVGALLAPVLRAYRVCLFLVAKPTALLLDRWLGPEGITLFQERDFRTLIIKHIEANADVSRLEGMGALNFLDLDDITVGNEGEPVDPRSILQLPVSHGRPILPPFSRTPGDAFLRRIESSGKKWVIITDPQGHPVMVLDSHRFLRGVFFGGEAFNPEAFWHRPILVTTPESHLGDVLGRLRVTPTSGEDDVIDDDLILVWGSVRRIITGADLLGRLLRGIVKREGELPG